MSMVEWRTIGDCIISLKTGLNPRKNFVLNSEGSTNYYITVRELDYWKINPSDKTDKVDDNAIKIINNRSNLEEGDVLFSGTGTIGRTALVNETPKNWNIKEGVYAIKPKKDVLDSKFLIELFHSYYLINKITEFTVGDPIRSVPMKNLVQIPIPVPSLSQQKSIVDQLDTFTSSIENLKEQISQRRKQYEYYRDQLLDLEGKEGVEMKRLGDICKLERGVRVVKKNLQEEGGIPVYQNSLTPLGFYEKSNYPEKTPFIICAGAAGEIGYSNIPFWAADDCTCILCPSSIIGKYVYYYLLVKQHSLKSQVRKASVPRLSKDVVGKLLIPISSLSEQQRIVGILDVLEESIQNLEAQLSQREKQYEYYRNKLLTFE